MLTTAPRFYNCKKCNIEHDLDIGLRCPKRPNAEMKNQEAGYKFDKLAMAIPEYGELCKNAVEGMGRSDRCGMMLLQELENCQEKIFNQLTKDQANRVKRFFRKRY